MKEVGGFVLAMVLGFGGLFYGLIWIVNEAAFPGNLQRIEQLRRDAAHVDPQQAEDVIGQVTEWNQKIAGWKVQNHQFIIGLTVPDGVDDIEPIEVPKS